MAPPSVSVYDHYRASESAHTDGVYRVVGADDEGVTLLRVGDARGRRVNTGETVRVTHDELGGFEEAENPGGFSLAGALVSAPGTAYWSVLSFAGEVRAHPLPSTVALALVLTGYLGDGAVPLPDAVLGVFAVAGVLGLAYVGSGRLSQFRKT